MRGFDSYFETGPRSLSSQLPTTVCLTNLKPSDHRMLYDLWSRCFLQFRLLLWMGWRLALLAPALVFRISIDCCSPAMTNSSLGLGGNTEEATHEDPTVELLLLDSIIQLNDPGWGNLDTRPSRRNYSSARISTTKPSNEEPRGVVFAPAAGFNTEAERDRNLFFARLALTVQRRYHTGKLCSPLPSRSCRPGASSTRQPFRNS